jgi:hypothetical protein
MVYATGLEPIKAGQRRPAVPMIAIGNHTQSWEALSPTATNGEA